MLRVISEIRPDWIIAENVIGIVNMALETVWTDLESEGYEVGCLNIPACAINAPHIRKRIWIVANATSGRIRSQARNIDISRWQETRKRETDIKDSTGRYVKASNYDSKSPGKDRRWQQSVESVKSSVGVLVDGLPIGLDGSWWDREPDIPRLLPRGRNTTAQLKALGNSVVPQIPYEIMKTIREIEG
jgi:DNA (cytosine-5)-methyltransferase 1